MGFGGGGGGSFGSVGGASGSGVGSTTPVMIVVRAGIASGHLLERAG